MKKVQIQWKWQMEFNICVEKEVSIVILKNQFRQHPLDYLKRTEHCDWILTILTAVSIRLLHYEIIVL